MAAGDSCTVNITDPRYGTSCSISSTKDCAGVCDGSAYFRCTSGSTSSYCSSGKYSVYLGKQQCSSGNATNSTSCYTCYTCSYSCPSGYYTSAGSGYYLTSTYKYQVCNGDSSQTNSTKCYTRASCSYSCPSGYATSAGSGYYLTSTYKYQVCNGDSSQTNSTKCYERKACSYSCPSGYYTSAGTGYHLTSTYKYQVCNGDSSQTNSTKCYTREADTCSYKGYVDSCPTGQTGTPVTINSGSSTKTCYKDCKNNSYTVTVSKVFGSSCPTNFASGFNGISSCTIGGKSCATSENSITISNVASGASFKWTPQSSYSNNEATARTSASFDTTITSNETFTATYVCTTKVDGPCEGVCDLTSTVPYYKVLQGNKCCCPTSSETNSIYCDCCKNTSI